MIGRRIRLRLHRVSEAHIGSAAQLGGHALEAQNRPARSYTHAFRSLTHRARAPSRAHGSCATRAQVWITLGDIILLGLREYQECKADMIMNCTAEGGATPAYAQQIPLTSLTHLYVSHNPDTHTPHSQTTAHPTQPGSVFALYL